LLGFVVVLGYHPNGRVIGIAAVPVAVPDLQGEGQVGYVEQVEHRAQQGPLPDAVLHVYRAGHLAVPDHTLPRVCLVRPEPVEVSPPNAHGLHLGQEVLPADGVKGGREVKADHGHHLSSRLPRDPGRVSCHKRGGAGPPLRKPDYDCMTMTV
jgi:hypothetical protein